MKNNDIPMPLVLIALGGIILLGAAGWILSSRPSSPSNPTADPAIPYPEISRLSPQEAYAAYTSGTAVILDVRGPDEYASAHIAGSLNIPLGELEGRLGELPPSKWIIPYCT